MGSNSFGNLFTITTWGESHGRAVGVVIDGCPAGIALTEEEISKELEMRRPGRSAYTSPRREGDRAEIYSGVFEGQTTGAPISIIIFNQDVDSSHYEAVKHLLKPGHAQFTYLEKYGIFDHRGGGRSSGRETVCRVAAGAVAKKLLHAHSIECIAYVREIGGVAAKIPSSLSKKEILSSSLFCPDAHAEQLMIKKIIEAKEEGDSIGGIVEVVVLNGGVGLGDPVYEKLQANLAKAMLSIPAAKGFEIGSGFEAARMRGSEHNDPFAVDSEGKFYTTTNHAGGTLGGISTGMPLVCRVAFKPPSSIRKTQETLSLEGEKSTLSQPKDARHDPCIAIRAVPVVEAMAALVVVDALLLNRSARL